MPHAQVVIVSRENRGKGTKDDPVRSVRTIYMLDGEFLAEHDPERDQTNED